MLREYKFDKVGAMNHIESAHGKKLLSFHTGTAYYTGQPRLYWQFEDGKAEWANPKPELGGWAVGNLFFPESEVVSLKVNVYAETFEFIVREADDVGGSVVAQDVTPKDEYNAYKNCVEKDELKEE